MRDCGHFDIPAETAAEALLALMKARGIDYIFANAGTDFPPLIEAYGRAGESGLDLPEPISVPHENAAVSMAHGFYLGSGRMQAAMVHVTVGMANSLCALMNAARENVPIFFAAGRTPISESGHPASRDVSIHWGQEMYDQAGMLRELVRWDYELRYSGQIETVVDRAMAIANSDPGGPVYLGMPRETLAEVIDGFAFDADSAIRPARATGVDMAAIEEAADILVRAERPILITGRSGRDPDAVAALAELAETLAIPVVEYRANYMNLPSDHPMHAGFDFEPDFAPEFAKADAVVVLDTPAPWLPARHEVPHHALVIQIGADPLAMDIPIRGFAVDVPIMSRPAAALPALTAAIRSHAAHDEDRIDRRRQALAERHAGRRTSLRDKLLPQSPPAKMTAAWASHCLDAARPEGSLIVNEIGCVRPVMDITEPGSFFGPSNAGGLGWGLPASLGLKMARPDRMVICCTGDGSAMFANPVACHQAALANGIATLTLVFNNRRWNAVKTATESVYPGGHAMRANRVPMTALDPSPDFGRVMEACGGYGETVDDPAALPDALKRAMERVARGQPALLNIMTE